MDAKAKISALTYAGIPVTPELARTYAAQLVGLMPDVILAASTINLTEITKATKTVPVVFVTVTDPVAQGFVASVRHPGGNLTGFSNNEFSLGGKWLDLLKKVSPGPRPGRDPVQP